ncbi:MAG: ATP-binding protein, partial [Kangiellaceae bacterium]|nr:ATP-binding protein [Kangiellaceae bacterium]
MRIIKRIEIKNFRSFLGTTKEDRAEVKSVTDLNIFSGSNDSGKSNILRAINLFFNDEIDAAHRFDFNNDFNILKRDKTQKVIEIKIYFEVHQRRFSISKFYDRNGYRNFKYFFTEKDEEIVIDSRSSENLKKYKNNDRIIRKETGYRRYAMGFISSISFSYVPAIREERFFAHLYGKILLKIKRNEERHIEALEIELRKIRRWKKTKNNRSEKKEFLNNLTNKRWRDKRTEEIEQELNKMAGLEKVIGDLEGKINNYSDELFSSVTFISSKFKVGSDLIAFFESFDIGTGGDKNVSLKLRGDGIQARFIPEMLSFLDSISNEKRY